MAGNFEGKELKEVMFLMHPVMGGECKEGQEGAAQFGKHHMCVRFNYGDLNRSRSIDSFCSTPKVEAVTVPGRRQRFADEYHGFKGMP